MFPPSLLHALDLPGSAGAATPFLWAYLDPGSGSLLFQMMIAGLLSGAYVLRSSIWSLRKYVTRGLSKD